MELNTRLNKYASVFKHNSVSIPNIPYNLDISILANAFAESYNLQPVERGIAGLITILEHDVKTQQDLVEQYSPVHSSDTMSIFTPIASTPIVEKIIGSHNLKTFNSPLLRGEILIQNIENIERLAGRTESVAKTTSENLIMQLESVTSFPKDTPNDNINSKQLLDDLDRVIKYFSGNNDSLKLPNLELPSLPNINDLSAFLENYTATVTDE